MTLTYMLTNSSVECAGRRTHILACVTILVLPLGHICGPVCLYQSGFIGLVQWYVNRLMKFIFTEALFLCWGGLARTKKAQHRTSHNTLLETIFRHLAPHLTVCGLIQVLNSLSLHCFASKVMPYPALTSDCMVLWICQATPCWTCLHPFYIPPQTRAL